MKSIIERFVTDERRQRHNQEHDKKILEELPFPERNALPVGRLHYELEWLWVEVLGMKQSNKEIKENLLEKDSLKLRKYQYNISMVGVPKTLKKLEDDFWKDDKSPRMDNRVPTENLKQEAINWVWFLKECMNMKKCPFYQPDKDEPRYCNTSCLEIVDWIKYFFNLKEKDVE